jgi:hypothetical protein
LRLAYAEDGRELATLGITKATLLLTELPNVDDARRKLMAEQNPVVFTMTQLREVICPSVEERAARTDKTKDGEGANEAALKALSDLRKEVVEGRREFGNQRRKDWEPSKFNGTAAYEFLNWIEDNLDAIISAQKSVKARLRRPPKASAAAIT